MYVGSAEVLMFVHMCTCDCMQNIEQSNLYCLVDLTWRSIDDVTNLFDLSYCFYVVCRVNN